MSGIKSIGYSEGDDDYEGRDDVGPARDNQGIIKLTSVPRSGTAAEHRAREPDGRAT